MGVDPSEKGGRPVNGGLSLVPDARTRRTRSESALDRSAYARTEVARIRDEIADRRDREAEARDALADERDELAAAFDAEIDELERSRARTGGSRVGLEILLRAAEDRKRAALIRAKARAAREAGARERSLAREDRVRAAADRRDAALEMANEGIDHLTGALRRGVGLAAVARELDRTRRTGESLVIAFVDVDGLKEVNDSRGHQAGDDLLRGVVQGIHSGLRPYDLVVRYGGDEFVCSLSGQGFAGIRARFDRIREWIAAANSGAHISVGLAEAKADVSLDVLIAEADQRMLSVRRSRQTGRATQR